jgi:hypothetical protein
VVFFDRHLTAPTACLARLKEDFSAGLYSTHPRLVASAKTGFAVFGLVAHCDAPRIETGCLALEKGPSQRLQQRTPSGSVLAPQKTTPSGSKYDVPAAPVSNWALLIPSTDSSAKLVPKGL